MGSKAARFKQSDVTRAFKGALAAGVRVASVRIDPEGQILIVVEGAANDTANPLDRLLR